MILINKVESKYDSEKDEEVKLDDPITRWKKLLGNKDPEVAKTENEDCLRAKYGTSLIYNAFHGSDNPRAANKERDIFKFEIPEKIPEFSYLSAKDSKVPMDNILKFLYPPNLEHPNTTGRLDIFAMFGPARAHFSVDCGFTNDGMKIVKRRLREALSETFREEEEEK